MVKTIKAVCAFLALGTAGLGLQVLRQHELAEAQSVLGVQCEALVCGGRGLGVNVGARPRASARSFAREFSKCTTCRTCSDFGYCGAKFTDENRGGHSCTADLTK